MTALDSKAETEDSNEIRHTEGRQREWCPKCVRAAVGGTGGRAHWSGGGDPGHLALPGVRTSPSGGLTRAAWLISKRQIVRYNQRHETKHED